MQRDTSRRAVLLTAGAAVSGGIAAGARRATAGRAKAGPGPQEDTPALGWTREYQPRSKTVFRGGVASGGGSTVLAGQVSGRPGQIDPYLVNVGPDGEEYWTQTLDAAGAFRTKDVVRAGEGYLVAGLFEPSDGDGNEHVLLRVDSAGTEQWRRTYDSSLDERDVYALTSGPDGGAVFVGTVTSSSRLVTRVVHVDASGALQWERELDDYVINLPFGVRPARDGGYLVVGTVRGTSPELGDGDPYTGWAVKLDADGETVWQREHRQKSAGGDSGAQALTDTVETEDGYLYAGFVAPDLSIENARGWGLAVDDRSEPQYSTLARPDGGNSGRFEAVVPSGDGYAFVGGATAGSAGRGLWMVGVDPTLSRRWRYQNLFGTPVSVDDVVPLAEEGVLVVATKNAARERRGFLAKFGGESDTPTPTPTATATEPPSPTPAGTETATPTPTPTPPTRTGAAPAAGEAATTSGDGPGFGVLGTLGALGAGELLRRISTVDD